MHIFCSKKLHEFVGDVQKKLLTENIERNLRNWNGHLFFLVRKKCLVFVNNLTNYAVFMPDFVKTDLPNFETFVYDRLEEQLKHDGVIANSKPLIRSFRATDFNFIKRIMIAG